MKLLYFLIIVFVGLSNIAQLDAYTSTDSLKMLLNTLEDDRKRLEVMIELGRELNKTIPSQALPYLNSALILGENQENPDASYHINSLIGASYGAQGNQNKAVSAYRKAAEIAENSLNKQLQSMAYLKVGDTYSTLQKFDVAIIYYIKAKRIYEAQKSQKLLGQTLKKIAISHHANNRMDAAIQYNLLALEALSAFKGSENFAEGLENLGELYFENSEFGKSANYYKRSIKLFKQLNADVNFEYLYGQLGSAQRFAGDEAGALVSLGMIEGYTLSKQLKEEPLDDMSKETAMDSSLLMTAMVDTTCIEDLTPFEEETFSASDSFTTWITPKLDNKPTTQTTTPSNTNEVGNEVASNITLGKMFVMSLGFLVLGILFGFLWCIHQYKKKWQELQRYMENKDEKLLQQSREIKTLEKELQFFNQALYKGLQMPATDVKVNSNLLKEKYNGEIDKEGTKYINQIQKSATNLEGLLTAIFNFQQIKHYGLQVKEVNVSRMAKTITEELKSRYPKREIRFWVQEDMKINADEELVRLLLANLLHNALKFTQKNPIAIIEFGRKEHIFYIKDNGDGFHPQEAKLLFETFEPLKHVKNFEALTVSLLSMQTIVQKHAGTIWTVSQEEKGATFFFTLDATPVKTEATAFWNLSKSPHFKLAL